MEFTKVFNVALAHKSRIDTVQRDFEDNQTKIGNYNSDLKVLNELYKTTDYAHIYLEALIKEEATKFIRNLRDILDKGVKDIFYDEQYSIDIRTKDDTTTIHLITSDAEGNQISPDIKYCGGGIRTVVGVLFQIYFIFHYKSEPIIFVDEGFSQVSSQYIPYLMGLIQELSERNGMKILLITHDDRFKTYANKVYEIMDGTAVLKKGKISNVDIKGGND